MSEVQYDFEWIWVPVVATMPVCVPVASFSFQSAPCTQSRWHFFSRLSSDCYLSISSSFMMCFMVLSLSFRWPSGLNCRTFLSAMVTALLAGLIS